MNGKRKPKFSVGDSVMIEPYGFMSTIESIKFFEQQWVYRLKGKKEYFLEEQLMNMNEKKGNIQNQEYIPLSYKYQFGDIVKVKGYGQDFFIVIGFRIELWRYRDSAWEDIIYELSRIEDGQWLEASEDELTFIADEEKAKMLFQTKSKIKKLPPPSNRKKTAGKGEMADIDYLLDMYNDYQNLYQFFGDETYHKKMKEIMRKLDAMLKNQNHLFKNDDSH